nr:immunoglobulin light chain junction region [Macaca mulatta]
CHQHHSYPWTF